MQDQRKEDYYAYDFYTDLPYLKFCPIPGLGVDDKGHNINPSG